MKFTIPLLLLAIRFSYPSHLNDSSQLNDYKIAQVVRTAVREADSTLLATSSFAVWRDYLKIVATRLKLQLQPLLLIKFDEDAAFRNQLKAIVEWERWQKKETDHFIYYYRWDQPPPEIILGVQDAHLNEIVKLFKIEVKEKIPFRYDLTLGSTIVYPYEDLRGGLVSPLPFDLQKGALAIFNFINPQPAVLLEPLATIYGSYFQNPSTSKAFYEKCLAETRRKGYIPMVEILERQRVDRPENQERFSAYAFVYTLDQQFGPQRIAKFLAGIARDDPSEGFEKLFAETFETNLVDFEDKLRGAAVTKL